MSAWQDYLREARRFWDVAEAADTPGYRNQGVSNAVHAVIAANDALCLYHLGERAQGDSHTEAAMAPKRACKGTALEQEAPQRAGQLTDVVKQKSPLQYYGKQLSAETVSRVMGQAKRFIEWVEESLPQPDAQQPPRDE